MERVHHSAETDLSSSTKNATMATLIITMDVLHCVKHKVVTLPATVQGMFCLGLMESVRGFVAMVFWSKPNNVMMGT